MPPYNSPKDLRELPLDFIPEGDFILPICTNRERFFLMLQALQYYRSRTENHLDLDHMIDFMEGWAYLGNPTDSPCFPHDEITEDRHTCVDYPANSTIITYAPQNPFTQPDYVPPGYTAPPFVVVDTTDVFDSLAGYLPGDVVTGFLAIPVGTPALGQGLARIRVKFSGTGEVELHLLKLFLGGMVLITRDDDPLTAQTLMLYKDPLQLPLEIITEIVVEEHFTTPGNHHIDITFLPRFNDELTFVTYGGGLRSVVLCGFDKTLNQVVEERAHSGAISIEDEPDMGLRISPDNPCIIQRECSPGEWVDWYDPRTCLQQDIVVQPPPAGELSENDCSVFDLNVQGNGIAISPVPVQEGYTIQIENVSGGWSNNSTSWFCPNGQTYALGLCTELGAGTDAGNPRPDLRTGRLLAEIDGVFYDAYNTTITVPVGTALTDLKFQMNDGDLTDNHGSVGFRVTICAIPPASWGRTYDFRYVTGAMVPTAWPTGDVMGHYVAGTGWVSNCGHTVVGQPHEFDMVEVVQTYSEPITLTHIDVLFNLTITTNPTPDLHYIIIEKSGVQTFLENPVPVSGDDQTIEWDGYETGVTKLIVRIEGNVYIGGGCSSDGLGVLRQLHIEGVGENVPA